MGSADRLVSEPVIEALEVFVRMQDGRVGALGGSDRLEGPDDLTADTLSA